MWKNEGKTFFFVYKIAKAIQRAFCASVARAWHLLLHQPQSIIEETDKGGTSGKILAKNERPLCTLFK